MKIEVDENRNILLKEVYNPVVFETADGEKLSVSMRDSGFECVYECGESVRVIDVKNGLLKFR